jgi:hypothetical protein
MALTMAFSRGGEEKSSIVFAGKIQEPSEADVKCYLEF